MEVAHGLIMQGEKEQALSVLQEVVSKGPADPTLLGLLGTLSMDLGRLEEARKWLLEATSRDDQSPATWYNLGRLLQVQRRHREAASAYRRATALDPHLAVAWNNLGLVLREQGRLSNAKKALEQAVSLEPEVARWWNNLAVVLEDLGLGDRAVEAYKRACELSPAEPYLLVNTGQLLQRMERHQEAASAYRRALELDPDNQQALFLLSSLGECETPPAAPATLVKAIFDQEAPLFEDTLINKLHYRTPELIYSMVSERLGTGLDILDLGCGTGLGAKLYRPHARLLTGVDISREMLARAEEKGLYDRLLSFDIGSQWPGNSAYDLVVANDVFVYFGDISQVLSRIRKALRPKGLLAFSVEELEQESERGYKLHHGGRYAHHPTWVARTGEETGFSLLEEKKADLRLEAAKPVRGRLFLLERSPGDPDRPSSR